MARSRTSKRPNSNTQTVADLRHLEKRKNNPPAGLAPTYEVRERQTTRYNYDPHLDPQLIWSEKPGLRAKWEEIWDPDQTAFEVDVVSVHIHERVSTRAILEAVRRPEPQLSLFGETPLSADQQVEFYKHDVDWVNRLILGDSLLVMNSLLVKEGMAGKVQMIYLDPPYGIKYASNFQARTDRRDVKDRDEDLTHEPEQIKAYRDTWQLGIHSYLTYLRDRLLLARDLLSESGSIFVQIGEENLHRVRDLLDESFGAHNACGIIMFAKSGGTTSELLPSPHDFLLWYAKDRTRVKEKFRRLFRGKGVDPDEHTAYSRLELADGTRRGMTQAEFASRATLPQNAKVYRLDNLTSQGFRQLTTVGFEFDGQSFHPGKERNWKTTIEGLGRLAEAGRLESTTGLYYVRFLNDFRVSPMSNRWEDTGIAGYASDKKFVVETNTKVIERCILMTTDPGDLTLDPTCGSGTAAYSAEKWGRRWITCDTSRVALTIARQKLLTARYDYHELKDSERGVSGGFEYETVPHVTLESIAKNTEIDAIAAKYDQEIEAALAELNKVIKEKWKEWEAPRESEKGWPKAALAAHERFWALRHSKREEIDGSIQRNAAQETLYEKPKVRRGVIRVSGPFTVEAIPAPALEDPSQTPVAQFEQDEARARVSDPAGDYRTTMISLLKQQGGVIFPGGKKMTLQNPRPLNLGMLHAEAETGQNGKSLRIAISFGPQYGPVTAAQVQETIPTAQLNGYDVLIFAGFSFDPEAQALIQTQPVKLQVHFANVAPDVLVGDLLKTNRASQIFTAFGQPDIRVRPEKDATSVVDLLGVDIYDPLTGETRHAPGTDVAAWFLDTDYDGATFHVSQAFFPGDEDAWDKLQRALKATIDAEAFERMRGTRSFPFKTGKHKRIAVKVIDFRGNEVVRVMSLDGASRRAAP